MYYDYFHLKENPFRLNTDTNYLYLSKEHARAKAYLEYALINEENLLVLTGEIGAGKSIVVQSVLENLNDDVLIVKIHQTQLSVVEFLQMLLLELGVKSFHNRKVELLSQIKEILLQYYQDGTRVLLVIDEAQHLNSDVLEEIRFLSDLELHNHKLINVFLVGQPELNITLDMPELEQLKQRVRLRFHLESLKEEDIKYYITFRLNVAGKENDVILSEKIFPLIYSYSGGRPRLINVLFDHALTCAFVENTKTISYEILEHAIDELSWIPFEHGIENIHSLRNKIHASEDHDLMFSISKGKELIGEFPLNKEVISIGRHRDNDLVLNDSRISRNHAQVTISGDDVLIKDLDSRNGTFVNLKQVDKQNLVDGMIITIGRFKLEFCNKKVRKEKYPDNENIIHYPVSENQNHQE